MAKRSRRSSRGATCVVAVVLHCLIAAGASADFSAPANAVQYAHSTVLALARAHAQSQGGDIDVVAHAARVHTLLGVPLPKWLQTGVCDALAGASEQSVRSADDAENIALVYHAAQPLQCSGTAQQALKDAAERQALNAVQQADKAGIDAVRRGMHTLALLGVLQQHAHSADAAAKSLSHAVALSSSDDAFSCGAALCALASLAEETASLQRGLRPSVSAALSNMSVASVFASADQGAPGTLELIGSGEYEEEDSNLLATALMLSGIARLGLPSASVDQLSRIARFVVGPIANSPSAEHAAHVALALQSLNASSDSIPPAPLLSMQSQEIALDSASPLVSVHLIDTLGQEIPSCVPALESLSGADYKAKHQLPRANKAHGRGAHYTFDLNKVNNLQPGHYTISVSADCSASKPAKQASRNAATTYSKALHLGLQPHVQLAQVETLVGNSSSASNVLNVADTATPKQLSWKALEGSALRLTIDCVDATGKHVIPSKMFAQLVPAANPYMSASIPLERDETTDFPVRAMEQQLGGLESGEYSLYVHVGGMNVHKPYATQLATIKVDASARVTAALPRLSDRFAPMQDMEHIDSPKDTRPPLLISLTFTVLAIVPFALAAVATHRLRINLLSVRKLLRSGSISGTAFVLSTVAYAVSVLLFWVRLNLMQAAPLFAACLGTMLISGRSALSTLHDQRKSTAGKQE